MGIEETVELLEEIRDTFSILKDKLADKKLSIFEWFSVIKQLLTVVGQLQIDLIIEEINDIDSAEGVEVMTLILESVDYVKDIIAIYKPVEEPA